MSFFCKVKTDYTMDATATRTHSENPVMHYWDMVKDLDDNIKLNLIAMLAESLRLPKEKKEPELKPRYTIEELHARIAQSERDSAAGLGQDSEEMFREIEEEFAREEELEMAEAI